MLATIIIVMLLLVFAVFVIKSYRKKLQSGCCGAGGDADTTQKVKVVDRNKANYPHLTVLTVDGMVCGNCAKRIENALNVLDGVWATADPGKGTVTVRMKTALEEEEKKLRQEVNSIGAYTVMAVKHIR